MSHKVLPELFEKYIKHTPKGMPVQNKEMLLCYLTKATVEGSNLDYRKVYVTTRMLKHLYDKRPAEEFFVIIEKIHKVVKYPDYVYQNKAPKRGDFGFIKSIGNEKYFSSLEIEENNNKIYVATGFRLRKPNYLNSYNLLWSWRDGDPSS